MPETPGPLEPHGAFDQWMMVNGPYVYSGCLGIFALGFLYCGILGIQESFRGRRVAKQMHTWPWIPGEVTASQVVQHTSRYGVVTYSPAIEFSYLVKGKRCKGHHVLPIEFSQSHDRNWAQSWVDAYPVGRIIEVYYNPQRPRECVVERSGDHVPRDATAKFIGGLIMAVTGAAALYFVATKIWPYAGHPG